ncbi:MAG: lysozyme inhibitor LprI family protein [Candidatus Aminicenantales bacterium]
MRRPVAFLVFAALALAFAVPAVLSGARQEATAAKHPIDAWLEECTAKDESTAGQLTCLAAAYEKWDAELNRVYQELMPKLPEEARPVLKAAQVTWLKHRDEEFKLLDALYGSLEGTMYGLMRAADRVDIVRKRALELSSYIDVLNSK